MHHVSNIGNLFFRTIQAKKHRPKDKVSSDAGPELAGRESDCGDGKPVGPDRPFETGVWWGINKSSSDDRPCPCICGSKYVEDAKAARSVRVWDRVPMKITWVRGIDIGASEEKKNFLLHSAFTIFVS